MTYKTEVLTLVSNVSTTCYFCKYAASTLLLCDVMLPNVVQTYLHFQSNRSGSSETLVCT